MGVLNNNCLLLIIKNSVKEYWSDDVREYYEICHQI